MFFSLFDILLQNIGIVKNTHYFQNSTTPEYNTQNTQWMTINVDDLEAIYEEQILEQLKWEKVFYYYYVGNYYDN